MNQKGLLNFLIYLIKLIIINNLKLNRYYEDSGCVRVRNFKYKIMHVKKKKYLVKERNNLIVKYIGDKYFLKIKFQREELTSYQDQMCN